jgi:cyclopropane fatty-acyl-phospholipid synthase-like methyltransferase
MKCSPEEQAQRQRYDEFYPRAQLPIMLSIERAVCGCDYGGSSWTTRDEAQQIAALLELRPGLRLLEVGAGSGWPGLYLAKMSGCDIALVDLPLAGLRIAAERAVKDCISGACWIAVADAATLPFHGRSFDAVSHSDVLCCLREKRAAFEACRQVIRNTGRMAFTVISVAPGLSHDDYRRAVACGPEFIVSEADYQTLLAQTAWTVLDCQDITMDYAASLRRNLRADQERREALQSLIGAPAFAERQAGWRSKITALDGGLLRRELFVAAPNLSRERAPTPSAD